MPLNFNEVGRANDEIRGKARLKWPGALRRRAVWTAPARQGVELGLRCAGSLSMVAYRFQVGELVRVQIGILPKEGGALIDKTFSKPVGSIY